jgi:hypothetical protein
MYNYISARKSDTKGLFQKCQHDHKNIVKIYLMEIQSEMRNGCRIWCLAIVNKKMDFCAP